MFRKLRRAFRSKGSSSSQVWRGTMGSEECALSRLALRTY
jgi:hypothetical protein